MRVFKPDAVDGETQYGGIVKIMITKEMGSQVHSGVFSLAKGEGLVEDIHENDEVFYVTEGTLTVESPDCDTVVAKAGEMVHIPPGTTHLSKNLHEGTVKVFWCNIEP